jgi:hypothetical protein
MTDLRDVTITEKTDREWCQKFLSEVIMGAGTLEKRTEWKAPDEVVTLLVKRMEAIAAAERERCAHKAMTFLPDFNQAREISVAICSLSPTKALDEILAKARDEALVEAAKVKCSGCRSGEVPVKRNNWYWHCNGKVVCGGSDLHELREAEKGGKL